MQHGMPRIPGKIAGRGVPQVCGGDAIRGQSMHRRARRSVGGWMPRIVPPLLDRAEAGSAGGEVPRMPESFKPGSAASRPPRMPHMPGKDSSRLFIVRQCWNPLPGISAMRRIKAARKPAPSISTGKSARTVSKAGKSDTASGNRGYTYGWHPSSGVVFLYQKLFQNRSRCGG